MSKQTIESRLNAIQDCLNNGGDLLYYGKRITNINFRSASVHKQTKTILGRVEGEEKVMYITRITLAPNIKRQAKPKILIHVKGGNIQQIITDTNNVDIVVVDEDNQDAGDNPVAEFSPYVKPDGLFHELFNSDDNSDREIRDELKNLKF